MSRGSAEGRLDQFLCFAVYSANLAFGKTYRTLLAPFGLTYAQYAILVALWQEDGQSVGEIGAVTCLASNTLTPVLKRLEALGHVERVRSAEDERIVHIRLTPSGLRLEAELAAIPDCVAAATGSSDEALGRLTADVLGLRDALTANRRRSEPTSERAVPSSTGRAGTPRRHSARARSGS